jgi:hypothetical protein
MVPGTAIETLQSVIGSLVPLADPAVAERGLRDLVGVLGTAIAQAAPAHLPADEKSLAEARAPTSKQNGAGTAPAPKPERHAAKPLRKRRKTARRRGKRRTVKPVAASVAVAAPAVASPATRFRIDGTAPAVAAD